MSAWSGCGAGAITGREDATTPGGAPEGHGSCREISTVWVASTSNWQLASASPPPYWLPGRILQLQCPGAQRAHVNVPSSLTLKLTLLPPPSRVSSFTSSGSGSAPPGTAGFTTPCTLPA